MVTAMADPDDVLKTAGRLFNKLGETLKETSKTVGSAVAHTSKQVSGLGRGKVKLELDQTRVAPGAVIRGRVVLALTEPVEAKRLVVSLRARQRLVAIPRGDGSRGVADTHADVYQSDVELDGASNYESRTVPFELTVPADALELKPSEKNQNPLTDAARTITSVLSPTAGAIEWQVIGKLEIAWGRDLASEVDITVAR